MRSSNACKAMHVKLLCAVLYTPNFWQGSTTAYVHRTLCCPQAAPCLHALVLAKPGPWYTKERQKQYTRGAHAGRRTAQVFAQITSTAEAREASGKAPAQKVGMSGFCSRRAVQKACTRVSAHGHRCARFLPELAPTSISILSASNGSATPAARQTIEPLDTDLKKTGP